MYPTPPTQVKPQNFSTLEKWLEWLEENLPESKIINLGLERVTKVVRIILKQQKLAECIITVGGTNGKGSTVAFLTSICCQSGLNVGALTSPHLLHFNERICINGHPVDDSLLCSAFNHVEKYRVIANVSLTYFEYTTLVAIWVFSQYALDVVLLEVGLGGCLDAVNCVDSDIAVVTTVALDHQQYLGNTVEAIAAEKAGIFRAGKPAIYGEKNPPKSLLQGIRTKKAIPVLRDTHFDLHHEIGQDMLYFHSTAKRKSDGTTQALSFSDVEQNAHTTLAPLPDVLLPETSLACALQAIQFIHHTFSYDNIVAGIRKTQIYGRMQFLKLPSDFPSKDDPSRLPSRYVLFDIAHNPQAAGYLSEKLHKLLENKYFKRVNVVFSVFKDKDWVSMVKLFDGLFSHWFIAQSNSPRSLPVVKLVPLLLSMKTEIVRSDSVETAFLEAVKQQTEGELIVVTGSFLTVTETFSLLSRFGVECFSRDCSLELKSSPC